MRHALVAVTMGLVLSAAAASAAACETDAVCRAARLRSSAAYLAAVVRCGLREPSPACRATAFATLERSLARADARKGCGVADEAGAIGGLADEARGNDLPALIGFEDRDSRCQRARWTGVARFARNLLLAHARDATRPDAARLEAVTSRLEGQLARALARAPGFGDCQGGVGEAADAVSTVVRRLAEHVCPVCGNAVRGGAEQCDVDDAPCPGLCAADCACPAEGFCGNNRVDPGEECDGTDAAACSAPGAYPQCGGPGRAEACRCGAQPAAVGQCNGFPPAQCPAGQTCANLVIFEPLLEPAYACLAPTPASCAQADECALLGDTCRAGECCAPLGAVCSPQNPCCDGASCGFFGVGAVAVCCRNPAEPCERDADCCQGVCLTGPNGGQCAFF